MKEYLWFAWILWILTAFNATSASACEIEGCSHGYWKNHLESWMVYSPDQSVDSVFWVPADLSDLADDTLLEALTYGGGKGLDGAAKIVLRQAVATLLNAAHEEVITPYSERLVVYFVSRSLYSLDREIMIWAASKLDTLNNMGCPLD